MKGEQSPFAHGSAWVRADFHLHTKADKEFAYAGDENSFVTDYVAALKKAGIGLGIITNHNKFDADEFKALRKRARKEGIWVHAEPGHPARCVSELLRE
jgi:predicted metal-dependent phosphoesterase TrpH